MIQRLGALSAALVVSMVACRATIPPSSAPPVALAEAKVSSADGVSIHYIAEGSGPAVVLAHCLNCNLHYWDTVAADLVRDHRVVRFDLAGDGGSGSNRKAWTVDAFAADIRAVVNAAGIDAFTLVGHSASGTVALEAARQLGGRVTGVVPVDSVLDVDSRLPAEARTTVLRSIRTSYPQFVDAQLPQLLPDHADPRLFARVRADAMAGDPLRAAAVLEAIWAYREDLTLDQLAMPIVAIDSDRRPLALDHNRAHAPQFDARVLEGTSHWLMLDHPAEFARTLRDVVQSIESGRARRRPS